MKHLFLLKILNNLKRKNALLQFLTAKPMVALTTQTAEVNVQNTQKILRKRKVAYGYLVGGGLEQYDRPFNCKKWVSSEMDLVDVFLKVQSTPVNVNPQDTSKSADHIEG
ncbi:hypothetical protein BDB00DRAFT_863298 [Zychaea mexicana]|uniref:uncharacterized protein n=1 Tax=Zychaea mexicana TaxID=64656 RepID=UPI0022FDEEF6|nr:uncharacterized protein BDB00DRAFT_863298 [Zychaea mexicana]KAI9469302.1 hypothetical protein BDB00DRAFT_863298 [Zychaea mexicana]